MKEIKMKKVLILIIVCSLALPILGRTELPLDKLALYMSFDNVSGDTVKDESKHGNNGKIVKASTAKGKGKYGDAMEFNGKDSHVLIKNSDALSISGEVTISVWVNWKDAGDGWLCVLANGKQGGHGKIMDFSLTEVVSTSTSRLHSVVKGSIRSETLVITPPNRRNGPIAFVLMMGKLPRFMLMVNLKKKMRKDLS